jgi:HK97 family phage prohead protease
MAPRETKRADLPLARTDGAGIIEGYASLFRVADSGGDIVMAGAFARSLAARGAAGVKMLWQHNAAEPIGVWKSIVEDARGLKVVGQLDLSVRRAREALSLLQASAVDGLSIGYRTKRATTDKASGMRKLHEIDLLEISLVTFPMLTQARVATVKKRLPVAMRNVSDEARYRLACLRMQHAAFAVDRGLRRLREHRPL